MAAPEAEPVLTAALALPEVLPAPAAVAAVAGAESPQHQPLRMAALVAPNLGVPELPAARVLAQ
jgi:hypothetical protein